jgi:Ribosome associated membrane protein RAMP4
MQKKEKEAEDSGPKLSPWLVGGLIFMMVGSVIVQVLSTASSKSVVSGN